MRNGQILDRSGEHLRLFLALAGLILVAVVVAPNLAQPSEPAPYTSAETEDLDGDAAEDTIMAAPGGVEQAPDPGEVYVVSARTEASWSPSKARPAAIGSAIQ